MFHIMLLLFHIESNLQSEYLYAIQGSLHTYSIQRNFMNTRFRVSNVLSNQATVKIIAQCQRFFCYIEVFNNIFFYFFICIGITDEKQFMFTL